MEIREGRCYQLALQYLLAGNKGTLVHGTVFAGWPRRRLHHAWIEAGNQVYEPIEDELVDKSEFYRLYGAKVSKRYGSTKAFEKVLKEGNYGPW